MSPGQLILWVLFIMTLTSGSSDPFSPSFSELLKLCLVLAVGLGICSHWLLDEVS